MANQNDTPIQWHKIYISSYYTEAAIIESNLQENQIPVQVLNKQDSMYNVALGEYEIYVPLHLKDIAIGLLQQVLNN